MVSAPDTDDSYSREYRWIVPTVWQGEGFRQAWTGAEQLDRYARNQWCYVGIVASVTVDGHEIGNASVWGLEYEYPYDFMENDRDIVQDVTRQALDEAQAYRRKLAKIA